MPSATLAQPEPVFTCHCTVGVGLPVAAAVNVAVWPSLIVVLVGWVLIDGANCTVRVAIFVVAAEPTPLLNMARYCLPLSPAAKVAVVYVPVVPPVPSETAFQLFPSVLTCHCTVGVGDPEAAAVNVAVLPAVAV